MTVSEEIDTIFERYIKDLSFYLTFVRWADFHLMATNIKNILDRIEANS
jgi:hypothetical protein